ncbi:MAG TPA: magnesium chelatase, partial [Piscirickettsiaceae bacterium]|nr:magnesium chelatase [Piscirickettsiaceae bacterium]
LEQVCQLSASEKTLLKTLMQRLGLSARAYVRLLRVARTLADLAGAEQVKVEHVQEAAALQRLPGDLLGGLL